MGAFGGVFSDEEIWAMIKYLRYEADRIKTSDAKMADEEDDDRR